MSLSKQFILISFLFCISFHFIFSNGCIYQKIKDGELLTTDEDYTKNDNEESNKKKACFSLSYSAVFNQVCCYDKIQQSCTDETENENVTCPESTFIPNNCGMAGIFQPVNHTQCIDISLVGGYCCYVDFGDKGTACISTKKLNDDKNTATEMINKYIIKFNEQEQKNYEVKEVICEGFYWKHIARIGLIGLLLIL